MQFILENRIYRPLQSHSSKFAHTHRLQMQHIRGVMWLEGQRNMMLRPQRNIKIVHVAIYICIYPMT